ncbi:MAG: hypothetical protein PUG38_02990 [Sutterellaceae bacterium]|nr:hypothetical protein [Sutterellaceae bacterium]MDY2868468.1 hypothetical protein [Mesosutterella sp.]
MNKTLAISVAVIIVAVGIFFIGYQYGHQQTAAKYEAQIASLKADWKAKSDAVEKEAQEKYEEQTKKLSAALAQRDKALASAHSLRTVAVRVRGIADTRAKADLQAAAAAGDSNKERLGRCEKLLGEGADLVGEGSELLTRVAADKDVVAN